MSNIVGEERYVFDCEWYDQQAELKRYYRIFYYPVDKSLKMHDIKNNREFLKRQCIPTVQLNDFNIGQHVTILSRVLKITDYGDVATRKLFETTRQRTFAMIKPDAYSQIGKIIDSVYQNGFCINSLRMSKFTKETAGQFYGEHKEKSFYPNLESFITSDVVVGMELVAEDAVTKWRELIGPTNTQNAKAQAPSSLRALFGTDGTRNAVHGSDSQGSMKREVDFWFKGDGDAKNMKTSAINNNCTLAIIKPHIIKEGNAGLVIDQILQAGFEISAMEMFHLTREQIEEFYDVYKGVLPEYLPLIQHMCCGPTIALEVRQQNVVQSFRDFCGPHDPEIAKHLRPNTLRAKFGHDRVRNVLHCTDLPEDGVLECEYLFNRLGAQ